MRIALCFVLLGAVVSAALNSDSDERVAVLDDFDLVELDEQADCSAEILQAKTKCAEKVAYYKKIHATQCGDTELKAVMSRIKNNQEKAKQLGSKLKKAKDALRQANFEEQRYKGTYAAAKEKLMKALVADEQQKMALKAKSKSVDDELKDQNSLRSKAHKATLEAVALAEKEPTMHKVTPKANSAKSLYAQMVDEKVKLARVRYEKKSEKKTVHNSEELIKKLFETAKKAREKELSEMKKVKSASIKVAKENTRIAETETKVAREDRDASKKEKAKAKNEESKFKDKAEKGQSKVNAAQALVDKLQKELAAAQAEESKTEKLDLKSLLAQAGNLLNKPTRERREDSEDDENH